MRDALISVNFICNLRCGMCAVWQNADNVTIEPALYRRLPASLRKITLTGGEIFLDSRLEERIGIIRETCPKARLILITNGSMPQRVEKVVRGARRGVGRLAVRVSLDGPKEIHDQIRGREGAYESAVETLRMLRRIGIDDAGVSFTLQPENLGMARYVMELASELGVDFVCNVVQNSSLAYATCKNAVGADKVESELLWIIEQQLRDKRWKQWVRAFFTRQMLEYQRTGHRSIACEAGRNSFYLNYDGGIYPCNILDTCLGSIAETNVETIFARPEVQKQVNALDRCQACWTSCNVTESLRRHPGKLAGWVLRKKLGLGKA